MKRSQINEAIRKAKQILRHNNIFLPDFAHWTQDEWKRKLPENRHLAESGLGWDVTDFGRGAFARCGSVLLTLRNGKKTNPPTGTPYAEKLIIQYHETQQEIPFHFHAVKTEDIINRGGGILVLELYQTMNGKVDKQSPVMVRMDGVERTFAAGEPVLVTPGNSITLTPGLYHRFYAKRNAGDLVAGEVSSINDDNKDNIFLESAARFTPIEEDEYPLCPLCNEYERFMQEQP